MTAPAKPTTESIWAFPGRHRRVHWVIAFVIGVAALVAGLFLPASAAEPSSAAALELRLV